MHHLALPEVHGLREVADQFILQTLPEPEDLFLWRCLVEFALADTTDNLLNLLLIKPEELRRIQRLLRLQAVVDLSQGQDSLFLCGCISRLFF